MHQSLVRNGNHFIKLVYQSKWFLIDGPWFDFLEKLTKNQYSTRIILQSYSKMSSIPITEECTIPMAMEYVWWKRQEIFYHEVEMQCQTRYYQEAVHLSEVSDKYSNIFFNARSFTLSKRSILVTWECNDGILPAWIKNPKWDENLEELFSYTTYGEKLCLNL